MLKIRSPKMTKERRKIIPKGRMQGLTASFRDIEERSRDHQQQIQRCEPILEDGENVAQESASQLQDPKREEITLQQLMQRLSRQKKLKEKFQNEVQGLVQSDPAKRFSVSIESTSSNTINSVRPKKASICSTIQLPQVTENTLTENAPLQDSNISKYDVKMDSLSECSLVSSSIPNTNIPESMNKDNLILQTLKIPKVIMTNSLHKQLGNVLKKMGHDKFNSCISLWEKMLKRIGSCDEEVREKEICSGRVNNEEKPSLKNEYMESLKEFIPKEPNLSFSRQNLSKENYSQEEHEFKVVKTSTKSPKSMKDSSSEKKMYIVENEPQKFVEIKPPLKTEYKKLIKEINIKVPKYLESGKNILKEKNMQGEPKFEIVKTSTNKLKCMENCLTQRETNMGETDFQEFNETKSLFEFEYEMFLKQLVGRKSTCSLSYQDVFKKFMQGVTQIKIMKSSTKKPSILEIGPTRQKKINMLTPVEKCQDNVDQWENRSEKEIPTKDKLKVNVADEENSQIVTEYYLSSPTFNKDAGITVRQVTQGAFTLSSIKSDDDVSIKKQISNFDCSVTRYSDSNFFICDKDHRHKELETITPDNLHGDMKHLYAEDLFEDEKIEEIKSASVLVYANKSKSFHCIEKSTSSECPSRTNIDAALSSLTLHYGSSQNVDLDTARSFQCKVLDAHICQLEKAQQELNTRISRFLELQENNQSLKDGADCKPSVNDRDTNNPIHQYEERYPEEKKNKSVSMITSIIETHISRLEKAQIDLITRMARFLEIQEKNQLLNDCADCKPYVNNRKTNHSIHQYEEISPEENENKSVSVIASIIETHICRLEKAQQDLITRMSRFLELQENNQSFKDGADCKPSVNNRETNNSIHKYDESSSEENENKCVSVISSIIESHISRLEKAQQEFNTRMSQFLELQEKNLSLKDGSDCKPSVNKRETNNSIHQYDESSSEENENNSVSKIASQDMTERESIEAAKCSNHIYHEKNDIPRDERYSRGKRNCVLHEKSRKSTLIKNPLNQSLTSSNPFSKTTSILKEKNVQTEASRDYSLINAYSLSSTISANSTRNISESNLQVSSMSSVINTSLPSNIRDQTVQKREMINRDSIWKLGNTLDDSSTLSNPKLPCNINELPVSSVQPDAIHLSKKRPRGNDSNLCQQMLSHVCKALDGSGANFMLIDLSQHQRNTTPDSDVDTTHRNCSEFQRSSPISMTQQSRHVRKQNEYINDPSGKKLETDLSNFVSFPNPPMSTSRKTQKIQTNVYHFSTDDHQQNKTLSENQQDGEEDKKRSIISWNGQLEQTKVLDRDTESLKSSDISENGTTPTTFLDPSQSTHSPQPPPRLKSQNRQSISFARAKSPSRIREASAQRSMSLARPSATANKLQKSFQKVKQPPPKSTNTLRRESILEKAQNVYASLIFDVVEAQTPKQPDSDPEKHRKSRPRYPTRYSAGNRKSPRKSIPIIEEDPRSSRALDREKIRKLFPGISDYSQSSEEPRPSLAPRVSKLVDTRKSQSFDARDFFRNLGERKSFGISSDTRRASETSSGTTSQQPTRDETDRMSRKMSSEQVNVATPRRDSRFKSVPISSEYQRAPRLSSVTTDKPRLKDDVLPSDSRTSLENASGKSGPRYSTRYSADSQKSTRMSIPIMGEDPRSSKSLDQDNIRKLFSGISNYSKPSEDQRPYFVPRSSKLAETRRSRSFEARDLSRNLRERKCSGTSSDTKRGSKPSGGATSQQPTRDEMDRTTRKMSSEGANVDTPMKDARVKSESISSKDHRPTSLSSEMADHPGLEDDMLPSDSRTSLTNVSGSYDKTTRDLADWDITLDTQPTGDENGSPRSASQQSVDSSSVPSESPVQMEVQRFFDTAPDTVAEENIPSTPDEKQTAEKMVGVSYSIKVDQSTQTDEIDSQITPHPPYSRMPEPTHYILPDCFLPKMTDGFVKYPLFSLPPSQSGMLKGVCTNVACGTDDLMICESYLPFKTSAPCVPRSYVSHEAQNLLDASRMGYTQTCDCDYCSSPTEPTSTRVFGYVEKYDECLGKQIPDSFNMIYGDMRYNDDVASGSVIPFSSYSDSFCNNDCVCGIEESAVSVGCRSLVHTSSIRTGRAMVSATKRKSFVTGLREPHYVLQPPLLPPTLIDVSVPSYARR